MHVSEAVNKAKNIHLLKNENLHLPDKFMKGRTFYK